MCDLGVSHTRVTPKWSIFRWFPSKYPQGPPPMLRNTHLDPPCNVTKYSDPIRQRVRFKQALQDVVAEKKVDSAEVKAGRVAHPAPSRVCR